MLGAWSATTGSEPQAAHRRAPRAGRGRGGGHRRRQRWSSRWPRGGSRQRRCGRHSSREQIRVDELGVEGERVQPEVDDRAERPEWRPGARAPDGRGGTATSRRRPAAGGQRDRGRVDELDDDDRGERASTRSRRSSAEPEVTDGWEPGVGAGRTIWRTTATAHTALCPPGTRAARAHGSGRVPRRGRSSARPTARTAATSSVPSDPPHRRSATRAELLNVRRSATATIKASDLCSPEPRRPDRQPGRGVGRLDRERDPGVGWLADAERDGRTCGRRCKRTAAEE